VEFTGDRPRRADVIDWNEMAIFVKVVQEGSFIEASKSMGVPRSTVSRKIAELEDRLGVRLLHRTTRTVRATDEGRAFFERCAPLLREMDEAARAVSSRQDAPTGLLRVTAPTVLGTHFLGRILTGFLQRWPEVRLELLLTDRVVALVEEGFDLAIRTGNLPDGSLIARRLAASRTELVLTPSCLERYGPLDGIEDLRRVPRIAVGEGSGPHLWRLDLAEGPVVVPVDGPLVVNSLELAREAALAGLGIARVPAFLVAADLVRGRLVRALPHVDIGGTGVFAVYPSRRHLSATVRRLVETLAEELGGDLMPRVDEDCCEV
jgi:DNA-binding transcriptional LysR family regulator